MPVATPNARALPALRTPPSRRPAWNVLMPRRAGTSWLTVALSGLLAANVALYVVTVIQEASLNRTQADLLAKRRENVRLRAERASAEAPDRVEARAIAELHLEPGKSPWLLPGPSAVHESPVRLARPTFGVPEAY